MQAEAERIGALLAACRQELERLVTAREVVGELTVAAYAVDVVAGSPLTASSLLGPNPGLGVRFFGIGNELERRVGGAERGDREMGFELLAERHEGECRAGVTYRLQVRKRGGEIVFAVDGRELGRVDDPNPWGAGLLGLRTFRTELWWDNVRVQALGGDGAR